ncbi:MAG: hypothetical protein AABY01_00555, partial [Nanoarchaeota archaeon]
MTVTKVIKIGEENYMWLAKKAADLQNEKGRPISFDEALSHVRARPSLREIFGMWKMTDKEAEILKKDIRKMRNSWK